MRVLSYVVPPECQGMAVKDFSRRVLGFSSRTLSCQKHVEGGMMLNGAPCKTIDILKEGDILAFSLPQETGHYVPVPLPFSTVWENDDYLVVDKPFGMTVHPSPGHDCDSLLNAVAYHYQTTGQACLFRPLYRLDKDTSGLLIVGKHRVAVSCAEVQKIYYGVCQGVITGAGVIDVPIGLSENSKILRECGHGAQAVTHWRALACGLGHTLLKFILTTGRTHQIRAHMAYLGHPLAGDDLYGGSREMIQRQALHCGKVYLSSKALHIKKELRAGFPPDMKAAFPELFQQINTM